MRLPWSRSKSAESANPEPASKSQAALAGADGDGKVHDLAYWIESGFLTLPKDTPTPPTGA